LIEHETTEAAATQKAVASSRVPKKPVAARPAGPKILHLMNFFEFPDLFFIAQNQAFVPPLAFNKSLLARPKRFELLTPREKNAFETLDDQECEELGVPPAPDGVRRAAQYLTEERLRSKNL
jgi:hypothetical protein